jgi:hypothetical protein
VKELRSLLVESFDLEELHSLCFGLGINFDNLEGSALESKARELIAYCQRQNRLSDLLAACRQQRPHVAWPDLLDRSAVQPTEALLKLQTAILGNIETLQKQVNILHLEGGAVVQNAQQLSDAINLVLKVDEKLFVTLSSFRHDVVAILRSLATMIGLPHPPFVCIALVDLAVGSQVLAQIEQVLKSAPTAVFILYTTPAEYEHCLHAVPTEWAESFGNYYKLFKKDGLQLATGVRKILDEARATAVRKMELQIIEAQL